jgi:flagellar motor switch protein FliM
MAKAVTNAALRRMVRPAPTASADPPLPGRILRQAVTRAADRAAGLALVVLGVESTESTLDDFVPGLDAGQLLVMLGSGGAPEGVLAIDPDLRGALIEMQTVGRLAPQPAPPRDPTTADLAMAEPFAHHVLAELRAEAGDTVLGPALAGLGVVGRFANARAVTLGLADTGYRVLRLSVDLGQPDRQGALLLALPRRAPVVPMLSPVPANPGWSAALARAVLDAPCTLDAILHRRTLTLGLVEGFTVGQVLPLPGVSVDSVKMEGPGGAPVGPGKLGQMGGMRAVRLGAPRPPLMEEMLPPPGRQGL